MAKKERIKVTDINTNRVLEYDSIEEASKQYNVSEAAIKMRCSKNIIKDGLQFEYANKRSHLGKKNKRKGNSFELEIVKALNNLGYNCVSSRSESKSKDNNKIDIVDLDNKLKYNIQTKYTQNTPNYFAIREECTDKTKPFIVIWKKATNNGAKSPGTVAIIPIEEFYKLL